MQLFFWPLQNALRLSTRQQAAIRQVLAMYAPTIFLVPVTGHRAARGTGCIGRGGKGRRPILFDHGKRLW